MSFPYKELTKIPAGERAILWNGTFPRPAFRYLWYELGHDHVGEYLIMAVQPEEPNKPWAGCWSSICTMGDKFFKLSLLQQIAILKSLPNTHGEYMDGITKLIREKLHNIL